MTVRVTKPAFNVREKLSELDIPVGTHGSQLMKSATGAETFDLVQAGRKNMIINGAMNVFQRDNGGLITSAYSSTEYQIDRFGGQIQTANVFTAIRSDDAPPGFKYSVKYTTTNAVTPDGNHYFWVGQKVEGYNLQRCGWNSPNPKPITISFWVKTTIPGTWALALKTATSTNTAYLATYDVNVANTWEYKTITVPPPQSLSDIPETNANAITFQFDLGTSRSGDLYASARNKWLNTNSYTDANCVKMHGISGATWQLTGFQVELGSVATSFEHRTYAEELAACQRYFVVLPRGYISPARGNSSTSYLWLYNSPVPMRATPTVTGQTWSSASFATRRFRYDQGVSDSTTVPSIQSAYFYPDAGTSFIHFTQGGYTGADDRSAIVMIQSGALFINSEL